MENDLQERPSNAYVADLLHRLADDVAKAGPGFFEYVIRTTPLGGSRQPMGMSYEIKLSIFDENAVPIDVDSSEVRSAKVLECRPPQ